MRARLMRWRRMAPAMARPGRARRAAASLAQRADYYLYLSALLGAVGGGLTLKTVFEADAARHGRRTWQGRASARWLARFQQAGGDLYATWLGSFPADELSLIRAAQAFGNEALAQTLAALGHALRAQQRDRELLVGMLGAALVGLAMLMTALAMTAWWSVPQLALAFAALPPAYHGAPARGLFALSAQLRELGPWLAPLVPAGLALLLWSMAHGEGRWRRRLDAWGPWRLYRLVQARRLLSMLAIVLGGDAAGQARLRLALESLRMGASAWQCAHVDDMLDRVARGDTGAATFDTGLLDAGQYWFLADVARARGLPAALAACGQRLGEQLRGSVARQAAAWRWAMLLSSVACLLGLMLWHYAAIDSLRRGLMLFYASG